MIINDFYGNSFIWFTGIIVDGAQDTARARVRIMGIHPFENDGQGSGPAYEAVSNGDLPWAVIGFPVDSTSGDHNLQEGDWVLGFFADGKNFQQPVIINKIGRSDGQGNNDFSGNGGGESHSGGGKGINVGDGKNITSGAGPTSHINKNMYYYDIPGSSNAEKAFNLFTTFFHEENGVPLEKSKQISAGVVASLMGESYERLDPYATSGAADEGIAQWMGPRLRALHQMCHKGDFNCQLNYAITELKKRGHGISYEGKERGALKKLLNSKDAKDACVRWTVYYERPAGNKTANGQRRARKANSIYAKYANSYKPAKRGGRSGGGGW